MLKMQTKSSVRHQWPLFNSDTPYAGGNWAILTSHQEYQLDYTLMVL